MTGVDLSRFSELRRVFEGYLHEDFVQEHGSAAAALDAFRADASADEAAAFRREATQFLAITRGLDFAAVQRLLSRAGSRWRPASREEIETVLDPHR